MFGGLTSAGLPVAVASLGVAAPAWPHDSRTMFDHAKEVTGTVTRQLPA